MILTVRIGAGARVDFKIGWKPVHYLCSRSGDDHYQYYRLLSIRMVTARCCLANSSDLDV